MNKIVTKWNKEKGLTIISLVITIIVMMILAGISIKLIIKDDSSNNGIVTEIQGQTKNQQEMINNEKIKMNEVLKNQEQEWGITE